MTEQYGTKRMLTLRKLTRAAAEILGSQLKDYLSAVAPLLHPKLVLGDYISGVKETARGADAIYREIDSLYQEASRHKPFSLTRELAPPLEIAGSSVEITPLEYVHTVGQGAQQKKVIVTSPLRWVLSYAGFGLDRLRPLVTSQSPSSEELHKFVLHYVALQAMASRQKPIENVFRALRYSIQMEKLPDFGKLPLVCISAPISTVRPPDDVIIETTELSGTDAFEEVINLEVLAALKDPLKETLVDLAKSHGEKI
jgi:hypothetical protein